MRKIEGKSLKKDILNRIKYIDSILLIIKKTIKKDNKIIVMPLDYKKDDLFKIMISNL